MSNPLAPFAVLSGEGTPLEIPFGGTVTIKAHTSNTSGSMSVLEFLHPPKAGPALHTHLREDEVWYVLEGQYRIKAGDAMFRVCRKAAWPSAHAARRTPSRTSVTPQAGCW
jgi:hypothetical protein